MNLLRKRAIRCSLAVGSAIFVWAQNNITYNVGTEVSPTQTMPEQEAHIAVTGGGEQQRYLLTAVMDSSVAIGGQRIFLIRHAFSLDNGATWTDGFIPRDSQGFPLTPHPAINGQRQSWTHAADPVVALDGRLGLAYLAILYQGARGEQTRFHSGFYVAWQTLGGLPGGFPVNQMSVVDRAGGDSRNNSPDKPWIAVDTSDGTCRGNVYAAWVRYLPRPDRSEIWFAYSTDQAKTWNPPVRVQLDRVTLVANRMVQGPQVAVGPAKPGTNAPVYVVWDSIQFRNGRFQGNILMKSSTDCGLNFSPSPVSVSGGPFNDLVNIANFTDINLQMPISGITGATYRTNSFPALAASPADSSVAVAWAACSVAMLGCNGGTGSDVMFALGSVNFNAPVVIHSTLNGHQMFPALTTSTGGHFHATWLDTQQSLQQLPLGNPHSLDVYAAFALAGTSNFGPNARVTAASFQVPANAARIGDYFGVAARGVFAYPVWNNGGVDANFQGNSRLRFALLTVQ